MPHRTNPQTTRQELPAVLLDKVVLGFEVAILASGPGAVERVGAAMQVAGVLRSRSDGRGTFRVRVPVAEWGGTEVAGLAGLGELAVDADLVVRPDQSGPGRPVVRVTSGSVLRLPVLRVLRAHLEARGDDVGGVAIDGADNVVGPTAGRAAELLAVQLSLVECLVDAFGRSLVDAVVRPAAGIERGVPLDDYVAHERLWVRSAEFARDHPVGDAVGAVTALDRLPPPDVRRASRDLYDNGGIAVRWARPAGEVKAYAKRNDLLRVEFALRTRRDVRRLVRAEASEFGGAEAVALLRRLAERASAEFEWAEPHVLAAAAAPSDPGRLVARLLPLVRLAAGERPDPGSPGPLPSAGAAAGARRALTDLLTRGRYQVPKALAGTTLRAVLRSLSAGEAAPLAERQTRYTVVVGRAGDGAPDQAGG